jgi:hypothetical protein
VGKISGEVLVRTRGGPWRALEPAATLTGRKATPANALARAIARRCR